MQFDTELKKGGGLLRIARDRLILQGHTCIPAGGLSDRYCVYAYRFLGFLLVAKKQIYGNIVSVHAQAVKVAKAERRLIIMYIEAAQAYYVFNPQEIEAFAQVNRRDNVEMLNFPVRLGRNLERYDDEMAKPRQRTLFEVLA